jgi:hypothetical protein
MSSDSLHIFLVMLIMLGAGILGGYINHLQTGKAEPDNTPWKCLVIGIGASALVPLFLNMISSNLFDEVLSNAPSRKLSTFFVFAGLCLVAAIASTRFIGTLLDKLFAQVQKLQDKTESLEAKTEQIGKKTDRVEVKTDQAEQKAAFAVEAAVSEPDEVATAERIQRVLSNVTSVGASSSIASANDPADRAHDIDEQKREVLRALANSRWSLRTFGGIAKEIDATPGQVRDALVELQSYGLAQITDRPSGPKACLTARGLEVVRAEDRLKTET